MSAVRVCSQTALTLSPRFALLDYALAGALTQFGDPDLLMFLTCDKGCQYGVNLASRFRTAFPELAALAEMLQVLVNKLHLQGHKEDCRFIKALQWTYGCGRTDGEGVERPWPHSNETAKITQDQNPGHRKDTFDDTNADWNYRKVISMGECASLPIQTLILLSVFASSEVAHRVQERYGGRAQLRRRQLASRRGPGF